MSDIDEYLRRNDLVAKAIGITANTSALLARLEKQARPPKWLIDGLVGIADRSILLPRELAQHRDEIDPESVNQGRGD